MPLAEQVSAFAVYKGLTGKLSKKQRQRLRNKKKKNEMSQASTDTNEATNNTVPVNENKKKRKNTEVKDLLKKKKRKFNDLKVDKGKKDVNGTQTHLESSKRNLAKLKKQLNSSKPKKFSMQVKSEKQTGNEKRKQVEKKLGNMVAKKNKNFKEVNNINDNRERFNEEQVKKIIPSEAKTNTDNHLVNKSSFTKKEKKLKTTSKVMADSECVENDNEQRKLSKPSFGVFSVENFNQDNGPTLISEIKQLKGNLASKDAKNIEKPTFKQLAVHQTIVAERLRSSTDEGEKMFQDLISPYDINLFFKDYWEKAPLYVPAPNPVKFKNLISTRLIDDYLRKNVVMFGKHIDITSYKDGKRETHNPEGRALPHVVWDLYNHKCSVRLLCPQAAFSNIFAMNTKLQEYFGCFVGANAYLTPPKSQGFAPHYDDIEAFVLQIEGQKKWKIYSPRFAHETLPRYSSKNFSQFELNDPIMEVTLHPGDMLYFPRGFIHQAECSKEAHSLHITVSMYQKNSWIDLLEKAVPLALAKAAKDDVEFRRGLPLNYLKRAGMAYKSHGMRKALIKSLQEKMTKLVKYLDVDKAVDMMGVQYITDALPPVFNLDEASRCVLGNGLRMEENGKLKGGIEFTADTRVRFSTALCHRLIKETVTRDDGQVEDEIRLYYSNDNSLEYHGEEPQFLVIPENYVQAIRVLSSRYPNFLEIKFLPLPSLEEKATLVGDLWDRGILMTEEPLDEQDVIESPSDEEEEEETEEMVEEEQEQKEFIRSLKALREKQEKKKVPLKVKFQFMKRSDDIEEKEEDEEDDDEDSSDDENEEESLWAYDKAITDIDKFVVANEMMEESEDEFEDEAEEEDEEEVDDEDEGDEFEDLDDEEDEVEESEDLDDEDEEDDEFNSLASDEHY